MFNQLILSPQLICYVNHVHLLLMNGSLCKRTGRKDVLSQNYFTVKSKAGEVKIIWYSNENLLSLQIN